jgi:GDP-L-fucose synthase
MRPGDRIFVAGHRGLVGSALMRRLAQDGHAAVITRPRTELDLADAAAVRAFFDAERPQYVFLAAARVGGIVANASYPADFIRDNLAIELAVIDAAHRSGVEKLLFLGSSCVYPKHAPQPMREEHLLTGPLEPTNEAYAIAKIAGIRLCDAYRKQHGARFFSVMPTNLYGPNDNFDLETSHVVPALIRRFHEAKLAGAPTVTLWGTGTPRREFLHVDDLADACVRLMNEYEALELVNIGVGRDIEIRALAELIRSVVGYDGAIEWDTTRPDGARGPWRARAGSGKGAARPAAATHRRPSGAGGGRGGRPCPASRIAVGSGPYECPHCRIRREIAHAPKLPGGRLDRPGHGWPRGDAPLRPEAARQGRRQGVLAEPPRRAAVAAVGLDGAG